MWPLRLAPAHGDTRAPLHALFEEGHAFRNPTSQRVEDVLVEDFRPAEVAQRVVGPAHGRARLRRDAKVVERRDAKVVEGHYRHRALAGPHDAVILAQGTTTGSPVPPGLGRDDGDPEVSRQPLGLPEMVEIEIAIGQLE